MTEVVTRIRNKLKQMNGEDTKDVYMFEVLDEYRTTPYIFDLLNLVATDKDCTEELWEVIADICFEVLADSKIERYERDQTLDVLRTYRNYLKSNSINMQIDHIPNEILDYERSGGKVKSKLHEPLHNVDLKILQLHNEEELKLLKNDAITLVAIIQKRLEKIEGEKTHIQYFQSFYRDSLSRKQMIKMSVVRFHSITRSGIPIERKEVLFHKELTFKKSNKDSISEINKIIKQLNSQYQLKTQLL